MTYFSLSKLIDRSQCEKLNSDYKRGKKMGKGAYGDVYELCKDSNCSYVLKVISYSKEKYEMIGGDKLSLFHHKNVWKTEVENHLKIIQCQKEFKFHKFLPDIYDAWFCEEKNGDTTFYIVMEKYDGDVHDFLKRHKSFKFAKPLALANIKLLQLSLDHIHNACGICIDDIKLSNILYRLVDNGNDVHFVFADFGTSVIDNPSQRCIDNDNRRFQNVVEEFQTTYN